MFLTVPQTVIVAILVAVLVSTKNLGNRPAILLITAMTLLHMYDHIFLLKRAQIEDLKEKVQTLLVVPKMPFGLTVFQVVQVLMLAYIILKQNKLV